MDEILARKMSSSRVSPRSEIDKKKAIKYLTNLKNLDKDKDSDLGDFIDEIENYSGSVLENLTSEDMKEIRQYPDFEKVVDEITGDKLDIN